MSRIPKKENLQRFERILALAKAGHSRHSIARQTGEHLTTVQRWLDGAGIPAPFSTKGVGDIGEELVANVLTSQGLPARVTSHGCPFDIECGPIKIEVKTAAKRRITPSGTSAARFCTQRVRASIHGHKYAKDYVRDSDFIVFVWLGDEAAPQAYWVARSNEIPQNNTNIVLNPTKAGVWGPRKEAWSLIADAFKKAVAIGGAA